MYLAEVRLQVELHPTITGGGLPHVYALDHLHFHWQSEHTIGGVRYNHNYYYCQKAISRFTDIYI